MKKILQIFSLFSLAFILSAVSANAQSEYGSEVLIPFEFNVGGRAYAPGKYVIKIGRLRSGNASVTIDDLKNDRVQIVLAKQNGDPAVEDVNLVFDKINGLRTLSRIVTPVGGYALKRNERVREAAASAVFPAESVTVTDLF
jgi:hypothetical protein